MKTSAKILLGIGVLFIILQYFAYKGNDFQFPAIYKSDDIGTSLSINAGNIIGYNFFGLLGLIFIIISLTRKSKTNGA